MVKLERQSHDIAVYRGDTIVEDLTVLDPEGNAVDISGWTGMAQVRTHVDGAVLLTLSVTPVLATDGTIRVESTASTSSLDFGSDGVGVWDLQFSSADATPVVQTAFVGAVSYTKDVTY